MTTHAIARPAARAAIERVLAFHAELVAAKRQAAAMAEAEHAATKGGGVVDLFLRLRVAICPGGSPPHTADGVPDIGYVMAALADEALLHEVDWPGRAQWMGTLLEASLYGSRVSGEEVFTLAEGVLDGGIPGRDDLAAAILLALSLGFRGRWRGVDDGGAIDQLRRRLYEHVYRRPPPATPDWPSVMPAAVTQVLDGGALRRMPRATPWVAATVASALCTLAASHWIWGGATTPLLDLAAEIRALGSRL